MKDRTEHRKIKKLFAGLGKSQSEQFYSLLVGLPKDYTLSKFQRTAEVFRDIIENNTGNYLELFESYKNEKSIVKKLEIRRGNKYAKSYRQALCNRPPPSKPCSRYQKTFWMNRGYTEQEAKEKVSEIQSGVSRKFHKRVRDSEDKDYYKRRNPISDLYWISRGYTKEEAQVLKIPFLDKSQRSYDRYTKKYGEEGKYKLLEGINKRKITLLKKCGTYTCNGMTSKESLKFFIPLYKKLRKMYGIEKSDIYWGIKGSREYASSYNGRSMFYDFTIHSLKLVIEYNNEFWHPREGIEWKGIIDYESAMLYDRTKIDHMTNRGYKVVVVWNTDNLVDKEHEILEIVEREILNGHK